MCGLESLQVSIASPFSGMESYERCKVDGYLLTDDPDGCLDYEGHQKAVISYSWLTDEEMAERVGGVLEGCYISFSYIPLAARQVLRRQGLDEMRRLWCLAGIVARIVELKAALMSVCCDNSVQKQDDIAGCEGYT